MYNEYSWNLDLDVLEHHGVLGQKWGVRRYQKEDGTLTKEGAAKYRKSGALGEVGRAVTNGALGQKLAVRINKGYRQDRAEIKSAYKNEKSKLDKNSADYKEKAKSLKNDYKETKKEAATVAADALYGGQSHKMNQKVQGDSVGKTLVKDLLVGDYGTLKYDEIKTSGSDGHARVISAVGSVAISSINYYVGGFVSVADYAARNRTKKIEK